MIKLTENSVFCNIALNVNNAYYSLWKENSKKYPWWVWKFDKINQNIANLEQPV